MDNARKDELEYKFIINNKVEANDLKEVTIQEIIFLISMTKYFKKEQVFFIDFDARIELFKEVLLDKIKNCKSLYIAFCHEYPYIDNDDSVWVFSTVDIGDKAKELLKDESINIELKEIENVNFNEEFSNFHRIGVNNILVDNGEESIKINGDELISKVNLECDNKYNAKLQHLLIKYVQRKSHIEEHNFDNLTNTMFTEVIKADYLVPILEGDIGTYKEDDNEYISVFTDLVEFEKLFDTTKWDIHILSYKELINLSHKKAKSGFVINSSGAKLIINEDNKHIRDILGKRMQTVKKREIAVKKAEIEKSKTKIEDPKAYPYKLLEVLRSYMRKNKRINKAYLRQVRKNEEVSFLVVLDFTGECAKLFNDICDISLPYLNGRNIDVIDIKSDFGMKAVQDSDAFYKKNFLSYFKGFYQVR